LLENAKLQTGMLGDIGVIQIKFEVTPAGSPTTIPATCGCLYLHAKTLWPCRIAWWGHDSWGQLRSILRIEFADPQINRALSDAECVQAFSYQPR
jgi:hypothetical protein